MMEYYHSYNRESFPVTSVQALRKDAIALAATLRKCLVAIEQAAELQDSNPSAAMSAAATATATWKEFCRTAGPVQSGVYNLGAMLQTQRPLSSTEDEVDDVGDYNNMRAHAAFERPLSGPSDADDADDAGGTWPRKR